MNKYIYDDKEIASIELSKRVIEDIKNGARVLALPTGNTPILFYKYFSESLNGLNETKLLSIFNLDEYCGINSNDERSFYSFMEKNFYDHLNCEIKNKFIPNGNVDNYVDECGKYESLLEEFGEIDIAILGVGVNGHIAFNEPGSNVNEGVHIVELSKETKLSNFGNIEVEIDQAITMGLKNIISAKKIYLLAFGESKREAISKLNNPIADDNWPITHLINHRDLNLILDTAAS